MKPYIVCFRVPYLQSEESIFAGVAKSSIPYVQNEYCECQQDSDQPLCGVGVDVDLCDSIQGDNE